MSVLGFCQWSPGQADRVCSQGWLQMTLECVIQVVLSYMDKAKLQEDNLWPTGRWPLTCRMGDKLGHSFLPRQRHQGARRRSRKVSKWLTDVILFRWLTPSCNCKKDIPNGFAHSVQQWLCTSTNDYEFSCNVFAYRLQWQLLRSRL